MAEIDWPELWALATRTFALGPHSLHGPDHWQRVERNALEIASADATTDVVLVRLFAVLHDSHRQNEGHDPEHGARAAAWVRHLQGDRFDLAADRLALLCDACILHDKGRTSTDPTIGACWDADRLDLPRVGMIVDSRYLSTARGKQLAHQRRSQ